MTPLRVLELGNYVVPAYCGMILAEQGAEVQKWTNGKDPILGCRSGADLWAWINHGKTLLDRRVASLPGDPPSVDIVIDNFRPGTLAGWGVDPAALAERHGWVWVSMRSEVGERSFDLIAQARSTAADFGHIPFWLGDTAGGLWVAWPKRSSGKATTMDENVVRAVALPLGLVDNKVCAIDETWTGLRLVWRRERR